MFSCNRPSRSLITREFIDLFKKAFPNIEGDQLSSLDLMLQQFRKRKFHLRNFPPAFEEYIEFQITKNPDSILMQGDIIDNLALFLVDESGDLVSIDGPAVVLSASCDCENDETILLASCFSFKEVKHVVKNEKDLQNNLYYKFFCFNNSSDESKSIVADFSRIATFSKKIIQSRITDGRLKKIGSLTQLGYYFFITKLYIHLLRIEKEDALVLREA
ncbi:hypothetical protein NUH30_13590 [Leptospira sp. 85282-16]|uniref:hypothetical protein n=1 Tax=Leptospira sp. 85282-16 TaxID=2971256 RepID=UPI0021C191D6|nr:hypothetical protein [Leptospira sp. 85282-16]MCT8334712.1 hypothetical protein [Leptospira sp. 85282-16]